MGRIFVCLLLIFTMQPARAQSPPKALPDGLVTKAEGIKAAWLINPTERYGHAVLGDAIEAGGFAVRLEDDRLLTYRLPPEAVFEDLQVRLIDLDGEGYPEAVIVKAYLDQGAALAVYRITGEGIEPLAETAPIGWPYRWLNPVGAADFDGDGLAELIYVDRPHILGRLTVVALRKGRLEPLATLDGFTNHVIGSRELALATIKDVVPGDPPEIILPDSYRRSLLAVSFDGSRLEIVRGVTLPARLEGAVAMEENRIKASLEDGRFIELADEDFIAIP